MEAIKNKWEVKERKKKEVSKEAPSADRPLYTPVSKASRIKTLSGVRKQMHCQSCGYEHSKVVDTEHCVRTNYIRRRRECVKCGVRYTTQEKPHNKPNYVTPPPKRILER